MPEIQIKQRDRFFETRSFTFPGGELQVRIPNLPSYVDGDVTVLARIQSCEDLVRLVLTTELIERVQTPSYVRTVVIPYFPYARQDRVMQDGESFSLKAFARVINLLSYDRVVVCDPHSAVTEALLDKILVIPQVELVASNLPLRHLTRDRDPVIVAPDAGAAKKALAIAQVLACELVTATKVRDVVTGEITGTQVGEPLHPFKGRAALIIDDICDGGRTFIELAKVLRAKGAKEVYLYVTHGIFSKGLSVFDGLINGIFTTNTFIPENVLNNLKTPVFVHEIEELRCQ